MEKTLTINVDSSSAGGGPQSGLRSPVRMSPLSPLNGKPLKPDFGPPNASYVYLPRADAMLVHRQMQLHARDHANAVAHGQIPHIPLPRPNLVLEDTTIEFESTQRLGNILWPLYEFMRLTPPKSGATQEDEITAAGYGLGPGKHGRQMSTTHVVGGAKAQAAAAAKLADIRSRMNSKHPLRQLPLQDHARATERHTLPPPSGPKSLFHPPPPLTLLDATLPQTVIYEDGHVQAWYFSASADSSSHVPENTILKKKRENCTAENIIKIFMETATAKRITPWQSSRDLDIVATFFPHSFSDIHHVIPIFLSREAFPAFIRERAGKLRINGVLQAFVAPQSTYNTLLRVEWTPCSCKVLQRTAGLPIEHPKSKGKSNDVDARLSTFERNWQVSVTDSSNVHLVLDDNAEPMTEAEKKKHQEEYLDMMLGGAIVSEVSNLNNTSNPFVHAMMKKGLKEKDKLKASSDHNPSHPSAAASGAAAHHPPAAASSNPNTASLTSPLPNAHLSHALTYNEHRMTQVDCFDAPLVQTLTSYCWRLAEHLRLVLARHSRGSMTGEESIVPVLPVKMSLYFKQGSGGRLHFLFMDEFVVSKGNTEIIKKLYQEMNDPTRDHLLKLGAQHQHAHQHGSDPTSPNQPSQQQAFAFQQTTKDTSAQKFIENLPIISPIVKRAAFNPCMEVREWLRYNWSHWQGEYEWYRSLGILDVHRDVAREVKKFERTTAAFYGISTGLESLTALPASPSNGLLKRMAKEAFEAEEERKRLEKENRFKDIPHDELPGSTHECQCCHTTFELGEDTVLPDLKLNIKRVLYKLMAGIYVKNKSHPSVWAELMNQFYPDLSEEKLKKLLRSKHWYTTTDIVVCEVCWEEIHGYPRLETDDANVMHPSGAATPAISPGIGDHRRLETISPTSYANLSTLYAQSLALQQARKDAAARHRKGLVLPYETIATLEEVLREYLHLGQNENICLDEPIPGSGETREQIAARIREAELHEIHRTSAYSAANALSIAAGMGDVSQRLVQQKYAQMKAANHTHNNATNDAKPATTPLAATARAPEVAAAVAEAFEEQRAARARKLEAIDSYVEEAKSDPSLQLFPGLDGKPRGIEAIDDRLLQQADSPEQEESLAKYHVQLEAERIEYERLHPGPVSKDGVAASWTFLKNTEIRDREAQERLEKRGERQYKNFLEQFIQEENERLRLTGTSAQRQKWAERFKKEWIEKLQVMHQAQEEAHQKEAREQNLPKPIPVPFPLLPSAGANPKFPSPEMVAKYIRSVGLPESYIEAYAKTFDVVLEPLSQHNASEGVQQRILLDQQQQQQQQQAPQSTSSTSRHRHASSGSLPAISERSLAKMSATTSSSSRQQKPWNPRVSPIRDRELSRLPVPVPYDEKVLPATHAHHYDFVNGTPEASLNVYAKNRANRSPGRNQSASAGNTNAVVTSSRSATSSSRARGRSLSPKAKDGKSSTQELTLAEISPRTLSNMFPYLPKSASTPALHSGAVALAPLKNKASTTFGSMETSPPRVPENIASPVANMKSPSRSSPPGTHAYASSVKEYMDTLHVGFKKSDALSSYARYTLDRRMEEMTIAKRVSPELERDDIDRTESPQPILVPVEIETTTTPPKTTILPPVNEHRGMMKTTPVKQQQQQPSLSKSNSSRSLQSSSSRKKSQQAGLEEKEEPASPGPASSIHSPAAATVTPKHVRALSERIGANYNKPSHVRSPSNLSKKSAAAAAVAAVANKSPSPIDGHHRVSKSISVLNERFLPSDSEVHFTPPDRASSLVDPRGTNDDIPLLDPRSVKAIKELHERHERDGEKCSCEELLRLINRGSAQQTGARVLGTRLPSSSNHHQQQPSSAARQRLENWLAENEGEQAPKRTAAAAPHHHKRGEDDWWASTSLSAEEVDELLHAGNNTRASAAAVATPPAEQQSHESTAAEPPAEPFVVPAHENIVDVKAILLETFHMAGSDLFPELLSTCDEAFVESLVSVVESLSTDMIALSNLTLELLYSIQATGVVLNTLDELLRAVVDKMVVARMVDSMGSSGSVLPDTIYEDVEDGQ